MHNYRVQSVLVPERATAITASGDTMPIAGGCDLEICLRYPTRVWRRKSGRIPLYCSSTLPRRPLGMRTCMPLKPAACAQASITATYVTSLTSSPPWLTDARFCCAHFSIQPTQGAAPRSSHAGLSLAHSRLGKCFLILPCGFCPSGRLLYVLLRPILASCPFCCSFQHCMTYVIPADVRNSVSILTRRAEHRGNYGHSVGLKRHP